MGSEQRSVTAVVVTFNRADKLRTVLEHLAAQTLPLDRVLVVDNASTDHTGSVLEEAQARDPVLEVLRLAENTGGAGGFATGLERAHADGADLVWIMDDDCYAEPDALERLVDGHARAEAVLGRPVPFAGSMVRWRDGSVCTMNAPPTTDDWAELVVRGEPATLVASCSFVALLVPRWAIEEHGLPLREYFIWFDDAEYTLRLSRSGAGIQVHDSVVVHDLAVNEGVNVSAVSSSTLWKFRYGMRNESSYQWHHRGRLRWVEFVLLQVVRLRRGRVPWRLRVALLAQIARGVRFDPTPDRVGVGDAPRG